MLKSIIHFIICKDAPVDAIASTLKDSILKHLEFNSPDDGITAQINLDSFLNEEAPVDAITSTHARFKFKNLEL